MKILFFIPFDEEKAKRLNKTKIENDSFSELNLFVSIGLNLTISILFRK